MDAKSQIKTRLKSNGTKIIGKSSAQKNMHPEVADIVKIMLTKVILKLTIIVNVYIYFSELLWIKLDNISL